MSERNGDTRKLLKVFGVAVTDFEEAADALSERVKELGDDADGELVEALHELLDLVAETNEKWQLVTDHLFEFQRQVISDITRALPE